MRLISLAVAVVAAGSWSCSSGSNGPQPPGEDYSGNFTGLWSGTVSGTLGGQAIPPSPAETEITRVGPNSLSISGVCPDGSAVPASVLGPATLGIGAWSCPPIAVTGCSAVTVAFTGGSGTLVNETLSLVFNGRMSGCGQSFSFQLLFTGMLPPTIVGLSPSWAVIGDPDFTLTVTGTRFAPGATVSWNGSPRPTTFVWGTEVQAAIAAADLAVAGNAWVTVSNPAGATSNAYAFEVRNPVPAVATLSPASAAPGDPRFTLTVIGSGFVSGTVVQWNGASRPTTVISNAVLHAAIDAADVATAGSAEVSVYTPPPGGGTAAVPFPIAQRPAPPPRSVAYQIDPAHSGRAVFGVPLAFPSSPAWSVTLAGAASYPLIAGGKVFVLTSGSSTGGYGTQLYALDLATGAAAWGPIAIDGTYYWAGHAYENGTLFVLNFDGRLRAFDAATGTPGWSVILPNQWAFSAAPAAAGGVVYAGGAGSGGTLYAVDEVDGALRWSSGVMNGDESSPAVGLDGVFVSYPCQVYKFDLLTGSPIWHYNGPCEGGGGKTAAYAPGALYVRDLLTTPVGTIHDAFDGAAIGTFGTAAMMPIPALGAGTGFFLSGGVLEGRDLSTQGLIWSFSGDGTLTSAPIVVEDIVVIGSASGTVYAVDAVTGAQRWSGAAGAPIPAPDEQNVSQPLTGLGAGEGYLVVPAGNRLTAWKIVGP